MSAFGIDLTALERQEGGRFLPVISYPHWLCGLRNLSTMEPQEPASFGFLKQKS